MSNFKVELKKVVDDSYEVQIGKNLIPELVKDLTGGLAGNIHKFAVITDSTVEPLYGRQICDRLNEAGAQAELFVFPAGEKSKVRKTKEMLEDAMLAKGFRRDCCVVAVGGGVVSDLAGFVAGTFGRGVPFVNYATTLLAAADASIGGKTATSQTLPRSDHKYISSFLGFAPADNPQVLVLVVINNPQGIYYGGTIAAPVAKEIFENILPYLDK